MKNSTKIILPILLLAVLTACSNRAKVNHTATCPLDSNTEAASEDKSFTEEESLFEGGDLCTSEDGRVSIRSDMYPESGSAPDYWAAWKIIDENGKEQEVRMGYTSYMKKVHSLKKNDGSTYYIVKCFSKASSTDGYEHLEAYKIVGDSIQQVSVLDGGEKTESLPFYVNYCIPDWFFTTDGAGYDWNFEYDSRTKKLYVPIAEQQIITDHYQVWQFNGDRFVSLGKQPHKNLHPSLSHYHSLLRYMVTKDYIVRVDSIENQGLRYASWKKPKTMADQPDIVIMGGNIRTYPAKWDELSRCSDYHFKQGSYEYIVDYCEIEKIRKGYGRHHNFLLVLKDGKVILKQKRMIHY